MNFTGWIQAHRRSLLFLVATMVIGGLISSFKLPVGLFPYVNFPRVVVNIDAGDRPADRMAIEVTRPVEEAVRAVLGVRHVRSLTSRGSADIYINFDWGDDMIAAMLQVESAINQVMPSLPEGTSFIARRMDPTVFPAMAYSLTSDTRSLVELRDICLYQLRPLLSTIKGVAKVGVQGGAIEEYRVSVDPIRLESYGISMDEVAKALSAANVVSVVGRLEDHYKLYLVVSDTRFHSLEQISNTILFSGENGLVRLSDVATASRSTAPQWIRATADGHDAVILQIYQQPGGNTVQIAKDIKEKLSDFRKHLPPDIKIANWYDQSDLILSSAESVRDAILIGVLFAAIVLLIFLRNVKITLIALIAVPSVLAATVLLLYCLNMSFNIMTLGGLAAAIGLIIDDTIVVVEHIVRRLRDSNGHHHDRVMLAVKEITNPLVGSSSSTIIIFAPLTFLSGVTGAFFKALSITMAAGLFISFFIAWLAVPILSDRLLRKKDNHGNEEERPTGWAHWIYGAMMGKCLRYPGVVLPAILFLIALGWFGYKQLGSGFMPKVDEGGFILDYRAPFGTSLTETDRLLRQVENYLQMTPEVDTYSRRTGLSLGGHITEANEGDFFIRLKPPPRRHIELVMDDIRAHIERTIPGLEVEMAQLMEDLIGDLIGVPQPIEIKLFCDDGNVLRRLGPKVAAAIEKIPGVVDVKDGIILAGNAVKIQVDRDKAALEGVEAEAITRILSAYLSGLVTTQVERDPKMVDVRVWIPGEIRATVRDVENLRLHAPDGHLFPLRRVANVEIITGQPQIMHDDLKRMIAVTGRISGRDMGSVIRDVKQVLNQPDFLPKEVYYELGGLYKQQQVAFAGLLTVFFAAVSLVYLLLMFLYESFRVALAMLVTGLLAMPAIFIGLWLTETEINISSMMGMTMIVGIITEVSIFYISEYYALPTHIDAHTRLILAGQNRMRPIAMTTLAAILALLPLGLGIGRGAGMLQPLAIAIISGLAVQVPVVLVVLPVFLLLLRKT